MTDSMADDLDPHGAATLLVQQHGAEAARYAAQWATAMLEAGNHDEARKFVRIVRAIRTLTRPRRPRNRGARRPLRPDADRRPASP